MYSNFIHMGVSIASFLLINALIIWRLFYYRKSGGGIFGRFSLVLENKLLNVNFLKLSFIFAALYFTIFIFYQHTGISCEDLDNAAKCQCYGLEMVNQEKLPDKVHWARKGLHICPNSPFFSNFFATHA